MFRQKSISGPASIIIPMNAATVYRPLQTMSYRRPWSRRSAASNPPSRPKCGPGPSPSNDLSGRSPERSWSRLVKLIENFHSSQFNKNHVKNMFWHVQNIKRKKKQSIFFISCEEKIHIKSLSVAGAEDRNISLSIRSRWLFTLAWARHLADRRRGRSCPHSPTGARLNTFR